MLNFCDFIQVYVFTTNHHLKFSTVYLQCTMFQFYLQNTIFDTNISELLLYFYNVLYNGISRFLLYLLTIFRMTIHLYIDLP